VKLHKLIEGKLNLGTIFDEFTASCFVPECNLITFRPDNWKETLEEYPPQGIFVESAWRGNSGAWQYRVAKYAKNMGNELHDLLKWAEKKKLPTIFWNKEDPPHYERFIDKAKLFDYVFTSDADCIPQYNKDLGHSRIFALPFAAQPKIHNPILKNVREHNVCFAGTYYGWSHEERRQDMKFILKPSLNFGLHIFDRQFGMTGPEAEQFRFPDIYQSSIKGRLDYEDMIKAYKNYKVFLNINSVKTSPTMFSRRVFELLACGTPVISSYSKGIEELLGSDLVFITESEADTNRFLEKLCNDDDYWSQVSVKGIRKVMEEHTYAQRLHFIAQVTGLSKEAIDLPHFTVVSNIENPKQLKNIQASLKRQTYRNFNVFLLLDKSIDNGKIVELRNSIPDIKVTCDSFKQGKTCKDYQQEIHGEYLTVFSARDMYGANYLKDYALAKMYCDYDYIGRSSYYVASPDAKLNNSDKEFQFVAQVPKATLAVRKEVVADENLSTLTGSGLFTQEEGKILSLDRFNYIEMQNETKPSDSLLRAIDV
jgi:spore maturation protein CgeB